MVRRIRGFFRTVRAAAIRYFPGGDKGSESGAYTWKDLLFFAPFFRPFLAAIVAILVLTAFSSFCTAFIPYSTKILIDSVFGNAPVQVSDTLTGPLSQVLNQLFAFMGSSLSAFILVVVIVGLTIGALDIIRTFLTIQVREGFVVALRTALYTHVLFVPIRFFRSERTGSIISRVSQDTAQLQGMVLNQFPQITSSLFTTIFSIFAMALLSPYLTLVFLAFIPFIGAVNFMISGKIRRLTYLELDKLSEIFARMGDAIAGIETVKIHGAEQREAEEIAAQVRDLGDTRIGNSLVSALGDKSRSLIAGAAIILVLWLGGTMVIGGSMSVGDFVAFMVYLPIVGASLQVMLSFPVDMQRVIAAAGRVKYLFTVEPEYRPQDHEVQPHLPIRGEITLDHLSFSYDSRRTVLDDISVVIRPGEIVGIIGETGVGKTTLVQLILRFYSPTKGRILLDGRDISDIRHDQIRTAIVFVSQDLFLFHDTIRNNIRYSSPSATDEEIVAASKAAQLHDTVLGFPGGYDTVVGERGLQLSAGQRQRISLARAFLRDVPVMILDEPSSSLDMETEYRLLSTLAQQSRGKTVVIITHRESILEVCDRVLRLVEGRLVEDRAHQRTII
jgi:ABC-type multidrug transport system fused ATPase/permease subunit